MGEALYAILRAIIPMTDNRAAFLEALCLQDMAVFSEEWPYMSEILASTMALLGIAFFKAFFKWVKKPVNRGIEGGGAGRAPRAAVGPERLFGAIYRLSGKYRPKERDCSNNGAISWLQKTAKSGKGRQNGCGSGLRRVSSYSQRRWPRT